MLTYILQIIIFQVLFLAVYDFFLSKETFHTQNRWYLLGTPILSFVLPLIKIPTFQKAMPQEIMILLPEVMLSPQKVIEQTTFYTDGSINYLNLLFWIGVALFTVVFLIKLFKIIQLITKNETIQKHFYRLVFLPKQNHAFSFFNYIFLGQNISKEKQEAIIEHELIHATEKHSLDLLFFELLKIVMWFNPMIYFYQKRITLLHEYISDAAIIKNTQKHHYFNTLLSQTFQVENISFVNQFYKHSLIKKRIIMMTKNKSKQIKKAKYLLLLPLLASMLMYTSCETSQVEEILQQKQTQTVYNSKDGEITSVIGNKETYLDNYMGVDEPDWKEIKFEKLSENEKTEITANNIYNFINSREDISLKFYELKSGRRVTGMIIDFSKMKLNSNKSDGSVQPAMVDKMPVFVINEADVNGKYSGEYTNDFHGQIKRFVTMNFDVELSENLGLSKGRKKIWIVFKVDKEGNVVDVKARAPHPKLKEEAIRIIKSLPKMKPAEKDGKQVEMKYTLPISFEVK